MKLTPWFIAIGIAELDALLRVVDRELVRRLRDPTAPTAVPGRVKSSVCIAILKPSPSSPSRFPTGTTTSWNATADVSVARWPILSRCFSIVTPRRPSGRRTPSARGVPFDLVGRGEADDPGRLARVRDEHLRAVDDVLVRPRARPSSGCPATSEPAPGSESPKQQRIGSETSGASHSRFCSSVPAIRSGPPRGRSRRWRCRCRSSPSRAPRRRASRRTPRLGPPNASGRWRFISPSSCAFATPRPDAAGARRLGRLRPDLLRREVARERAKLLLLVGERERNAVRAPLSPSSPCRLLGEFVD